MSKFKLLRADYKTGHVLNEEYMLNSDNPPPFTLFDNFQDAIDYIDNNKQLHINIEFHIYEDEKHIYKDISKIDLTKGFS